MNADTATGPAPKRAGDSFDRECPACGRFLSEHDPESADACEGAHYRTPEGRRTLVLREWLEDGA